MGKPLKETGRIIVVFMVGLAGCAGAGPDPVPLPGDELAAVRDEVRGFLKPGCGSCHTANRPTADPAALAVFDFSREDWSADMTPHQLQGLVSRSSELGESVRATIERLVSAELARQPAAE